MEKKHRIEGNDIVINHELCSEKELNHVIELASSLGFVTKFNHTPSYVTGFVFEVTNWRLPNLAKNKVIIDKLDEIFGYNKDVVECKWDKFREYWEELGKPELQAKAHGGNSSWIVAGSPCWYDEYDFRLKDDPNWEVRLAWLNSGKTLEIENGCCNLTQWYESGGARGTNPDWNFANTYRVKPTQSPTPKVVDKDQIGNYSDLEVKELTPHQQQLIDELNGITKAKRYNKGKPQLSYLLDTPLANNELAKVFEEGAKKYERDNWKLGLENDKLMDSALRHLQAYAGGEEVDTETGCHHLAHVDWNVKVLLEQVLASKAEPQRRKLCSDLDTSEIEKYVMKRTPNMEFVVAPPEDVVGDYDADVHEDGSAEHLVFKRRFDKKSLFKFGKMSLAGEEKPIPITRKELAQELDKDLAYVEKLNDGQEVIFNGATYVVRGD